MFKIILFLSAFSVSAQEALFDLVRRADSATWTPLKSEYKDPNIQNSAGYSPLIVAAYNQNTYMVSELLKLGADPNWADRSGNTALMGACFKGYPEIVDLLLKSSKLNINQVNYNGANALFFAVTFGHVEIAKKLIAQKIDLSQKDRLGKTAYDYAVIQGNESMLNLF